MAKNSRGKRPCKICRKWFLPDVRQIGRQKTCGRPACMSEQHRRQCEKWNKKNKTYAKSNYLDKKIEKAEDQQSAPSHDKAPTTFQAKPVLPTEIIVTKYGIKAEIIIQYLAYQIIAQCNTRPAGFT